MPADVIALQALGNPTRREIFERLANRPLPSDPLACASASRVATPPRPKRHRSRDRKSAGAGRLYRIDPEGNRSDAPVPESQVGQGLTSFKSFAENEDMEVLEERS